MKAFLTRRPSTAPSERALRSDLSHTSSVCSQEDNGDFYYPVSSASSATHGRSRSHAGRGLISAGEASGSGSGSGGRAGYDIGSAPASRAPPSSWARSKARFSLSRSDSSSSSRSLKSAHIDKGAPSRTEGAKPGESRLSGSLPDTILAIGASYDEMMTEPLKRRELPLKHSRTFLEKRPTHPAVFVVTEAKGGKEIDDTTRTHDAAATRVDAAAMEGFSNGHWATSTASSSHVTLPEALQQHPVIAPHSYASDTSLNVSESAATFPTTLPTASDARPGPHPRRMATMHDTQRDDVSTAIGSSLRGILRGLRRKASLPILSRDPLTDGTIADRVRQELAPITPALSRAHHRFMVSRVDLASELSDLAISHCNGLLSDEEYRALRKGLFESAQTGANRSITASSAKVSSWQTARPALDAEPSKSWANASTAIGIDIVGDSEDRDYAKATVPSMSSRERQGVNRPGSTGHDDAQQTTLASSPPSSSRGRAHLKQSSSSICSVESSQASYCAPDRRSEHTEASHTPSRFGSLLGKDRAPRSGSASIASSQVSSKRRFRGPTKEEEEERMRELERIVQENRSVKSLTVSTRKHVSHSSSAEGKDRAPAGVSSDLPVDSPSFLAMAVGLDEQDMEYGEKSSELIRAEIRILQAEGKRVTEAFEVLLNGVLQKGRDFLQGDASTGADAEPTVHWLRTGEWQAMVNGAAAQSGRRRKPPSTPPSAFRRPDGPLARQSPNKAPRALSSMAQPYDMGRSAEDTVPKVSSQLKALRNEFEIVESGKRDVVRRYDDRIAFLRSKERAAKIRESFA